MEVTVGQAPEVFNVITTRAAKLPIKQRLAVLYLIDSLCQSCQARSTDVPKQVSETYLALVQKNMQQVVSTVCPVDMPTGTQHRESVAKVLKLWISRKFFMQDVVQAAAQTVSLPLNLSNNTSSSATGTDHNHSHGHHGHGYSGHGHGRPESSPRTPLTREDPRKANLAANSANSASTPSVGGEHRATKVVVIWNLDDVLLAIGLLASGRYADKTGKDVGTGMDLSERVDKQIEMFADSEMFFRDLENVDQPHVDALTSFDDGRDLRGYDFDHDEVSQDLESVANRRRLAYRYRIIRNLYEKVNVAHLLSQNLLAEIRSLHQDAEDFLDGWLSIAKSVLDVIAKDTYGVNCVVSSNKLVLCLAKCVMFNLTGVVSVDCVYSAAKETKVQTLVRIVEQHGSGVYYMAGTESDNDWDTSAQQLGIPFLPISNHTDLRHLESQCQNILAWRSQGVAT
eukprot:c12707_g1_i2.p1 GENE.c12707_g1_i2~~c12707_g1_i2.p1  ORF type:complete len:491 (-),score=133.09 c12707_g1_i2:196-1557(-)